MTDLPGSDEQSKTGLRAGIWSRYWEAGAPHSCSGSFGQHYEGAIGKWWQQVFEALSTVERVLDLATGSGAVLQLALKHCRSQTVRLEGIDVGQVAPLWSLSLAPEQAARVHIQAGIGAERLPFDDQSFDLVTSQFGIEYTDLERSTAELRRVLRSGGSLRCILHHANSRSVHLARIEVEHARWLLAPNGLLQVAEQLCGPFSRAATAQGRSDLVNDQGANALRQRFNDQQDERRRLAATSECPDVLHEASDAVNGAFRTATEQSALAGQELARAYEKKLRDSEFRLTDLIDHALSPHSLQARQLRLGALGLAARVGELRDGKHLMGWWLKADLTP